MEKNLRRKHGHVSGGRVNLDKTLKPKDLCGIPWRVAFALQDAGWYLRSDIIWNKPNSMPESATDRPTRSHEYIFLLTKSIKYFYDTGAIAEVGKAESANRYRAPFHVGKKEVSGAGRSDKAANTAGMKPFSGLRNKRTVWTITTQSFKGAHFATYPVALIEPCILAGCPKGGIVLDPFSGAGTTGVAALKHGREYVGIELNPEYVNIARNRILKRFE